MSNDLSFEPTYSDGAVARIGDAVLIEDGRVAATIKHLIQTPEQLAEWGVEEPGVMFESAPFGLLFVPARMLKESPLERA